MSLNLGLQIVAMLISFTALFLNIKKNKWCWIVWNVSNSLWIWLYVRVGLDISVFYILVYMAMNFVGFRQWSKKKC